MYVLLRQKSTFQFTNTINLLLLYPRAKSINKIQNKGKTTKQKLGCRFFLCIDSKITVFFPFECYFYYILACLPSINKNYANFNRFNYIYSVFMIKKCKI